MKKQKPKYKLHKLISSDDLSSNEYHAISGTFSSSQFKDMNEDEEVFHRKHILKSEKREHIPAFDVGSYYHTGVLEKHKLKNECAVYPGKIRAGKEFKKFQKKNEDKTIITQQQKDQGDGLIKITEASPIAMGYVKKGQPEVSLFVELIIYAGEIYAPFYKKILTNLGWETVDIVPAKALTKGIRIIVKVRADSLGEDFVLDLKSTTGNAKNENAMRRKISDFQYELSAALYLDIFSLEKRMQLDTFIWVFASKDYQNCRAYKASDKNIQVGRAKYRRAILKLADCIRNDWQSYDYLGTLEPLFFELEHIAEKETDLV